MTTNTPEINTSERLFDLVRFMRSNLHRAQLISDEEYTWLCMMSPMAISPKGGSPSRQRLEEYDEMRADRDQLRARVSELERERDELNGKLDTILYDVDYKGGLQDWQKRATDAALSGIKLAARVVTAEKQRDAATEALKRVTVAIEKALPHFDFNHLHAVLDGRGTLSGDFVRDLHTAVNGLEAALARFRALKPKGGER